MINRKITLAVSMVLLVMPLVLGIIWSNPSDTSFTTGTSSVTPICKNDTSGFYWQNGSDRIPSANDCYRGNGIGLNGAPRTGCCPSGDVCTAPSSGSGNYRCVTPVTPRDHCREYSQSECESASIPASSLSELNAALPSPYTCGYTEDVKNCRARINCQCGWNGSMCLPDAELMVYNGSRWFEEDAGQVFDLNEICGGGPVDPRLGLGDCFVDSHTTSDCSTGTFVLMTYQMLWTSPNQNDPAPSWCVGEGETRYPCPTLLSFLGTAGIVIFVILIVIFYIVYMKKKKKQSSQKKVGKKKKR